MTLNLKELNEFIEYHHFKMDHFEKVLKLVKPGMFFASTDIRHAYYSVYIWASGKTEIYEVGKDLPVSGLTEWDFLCAETIYALNETSICFSAHAWSYFV